MCRIYAQDRFFSFQLAVISKSRNLECHFTKFWQNRENQKFSTNLAKSVSSLQFFQISTARTSTVTNSNFMFKEKVMKIGKYTFDIIQRFGKPPNTNEFQQSELTFYFKFNLGKILKTGRKKMSLDIWKMAKQSELTLNAQKSGLFQTYVSDITSLFTSEIAFFSRFCMENDSSTNINITLWLHSTQN